MRSKRSGNNAVTTYYNFKEMDRNGSRDVEMYVLPDDAPERLHDLLGRWQDISRRHPPSRADFPFEHLLDAHPGLLLLEPEYTDGRVSDLRITHAGPLHIARAGEDMIGLLCSKVFGSVEFRRRLAAGQSVLETGQPHFWHRFHGAFGTPPVEFCRLMLPLYDDQGEAECLLGSWVWKDEELAETTSDNVVALHG